MRIKSMLAWAGIAVLALSGCQKLFVNDRSGQAVMFSASADNNALLTKTSYSGEVIGGKERINWENGDRVRIYMYSEGITQNWVRDFTSRDYEVVNIQPNQEKSEGKLSPVTDTLSWREGRKHNFYSYYPSDGQISVNTDIWNNPGGLTLTLPAEQNGSLEENMRHCYMAAVAEGYTTEGRGSVILDYYPMVTTLYITLKNEDASQESLAINSIKLVSTNSNVPLAGTYTASLAQGKYVPSAENLQNGSTEITLPCGSSVRYGQSTEVAVFLAPRPSYSPTEMKLVLNTGQGKYSISLDNTQVSAFESCKKYNMTLRFDGSAQPVIEYSDVSQVLFALSDSPWLDRIEYLGWMNPPGLYYKGPWPPTPVSDEDLAEAYKSVTRIIDDSTDYRYLIGSIAPEDLNVFPNLKSIDISRLGNTSAVSVANLQDILTMAFSGNPDHVTVSDCSFDPDNATPLVLNSTRMTDITLSRLTGLQEIWLYAGDDYNAGGNIGNVTVTDCPDLKVIKVLRYSSEAQVAMGEARFDNLPKLETLYLDQVNATNSISVSNCEELTRFIVANQTNWLLKNISLGNLPKLDDAAADNSEYGMSGLSIDKVSLEIHATKTNCPLLGSTFTSHQAAPDPDAPVPIPFS